MCLYKIQVYRVVDHPHGGLDPEILNKVGLHGIGIGQHQVGTLVREAYHEFGEHPVAGRLALLHGGLVRPLTHDHFSHITPDTFHQGVDVTGTV